MHASIAENLPGYLFPHVFLASLPEKYEPIQLSNAEEYACRLAMTLEIKGTVRDYVFTLIAECIHRGVIREARRYQDQTLFVRFDVPVFDARNRSHGNIQMILHLTPAFHLLHYTQTFPWMKSVSSSYVLTWSNESGKRVMGEPDEILDYFRRGSVGRELSIAVDDISYRSLRLVRLREDENSPFVVRFYFDHPPFCFQLRNRDWKEVDRLVRIYLSAGLAALTTEPELEYWMGKTVLGELAVFPRLLFHRYMAEFAHNQGVVELLDRLGIRDGVKDPEPIWVERNGETWEEIVSNIYRRATGCLDDRKDFYGHPLTPHACDCLVAYAALEHCPEAESDLDQRGSFGCL